MFRGLTGSVWLKHLARMPCGMPYEDGHTIEQATQKGQTVFYYISRVL